MKLSAKSKNGLKAMCVLAGKKEQASLSVIADECNWSESFLEQVLGTLRRAGLVKSTRGPTGGYAIARDASEISVGEIIRVLEDNLNFVDCLSHECDNKCTCKTYGVWQVLYKSINEALDKISLKDLIKGEKYE